MTSRPVRIADDTGPRTGRPTPLTRRAVLVAAGTVGTLAVLAITATANAGDEQLSLVEALLLGAIEGLTEYLPVSSTGHLTVTQNLLGLTDTSAGKSAADSYAIAIQLGAIVAVTVLYRTRIATTITALTRPTDPDARNQARRLTLALAIAFTPAALIGLAAGDLIKERLFGLWPTVIAWFAGGVGIIAFARHHRPGTRTLDAITWRDGLLIGFAQTLALWPGVSRSLVTIVAAIAIGLHITAAVEFSFLLGLATLTTATVYETIGNGTAIIDQYGILIPLAGFAAALVFAAVAVLWMVDYLQRHSLEVFGWYRITIAATVAVLALTNTVD